MTLEAAFGHVIRRLRTEKGLTQDALSVSSALDRSFISQLECGTKQPSLITIFQLARALNVPPGFIIDAVDALYSEQSK